MGVDNPCLLRGGRDPDHQSPSLTYQTVETKNRPQNALTVLPTDPDQNLPIPPPPTPPPRRPPGAPPYLIHQTQKPVTVRGKILPQRRRKPGRHPQRPLHAHEPSASSKSFPTPSSEEAAPPVGTWLRRSRKVTPNCATNAAVTCTSSCRARVRNTTSAGWCSGPNHGEAATNSPTAATNESASLSAIFCSISASIWASTTASIAPWDVLPIRNSFWPEMFEPSV